MTDTDIDDLDLTVALGDLPEQWQAQPAMMLRWTTELADAIQEQDMAKMRLGLAESDANVRIRADPSEYGLTKATETTVLAAIQGDQQYIDAYTEHVEAKHRVARLRGLVDALDHRKRALQSLTDLWLRQWFSGDGPKETAVKPEQTGKTTKVVRRRRKRAT